MTVSKFYEAAHEELIQEDVDLKIAINHAEEERLHIMEQISIYTYEKGGSDAESVQQRQLWSLPWKTILDMQKLLKQMQDANKEVLFALRKKQTDLRQAIQDQFGSKSGEN